MDIKTVEEIVIGMANIVQKKRKLEEENAQLREILRKYQFCSGGTEEFVKENRHKSEVENEDKTLEEEAHEILADLFGSLFGKGV